MMDRLRPLLIGFRHVFITEITWAEKEEGSVLLCLSDGVVVKLNVLVFETSPTGEAFRKRICVHAKG